MELKSYFRVFIFIALIFLLYLSGLSMHLIIILGIIIGLSMILKGKIYKKFDEFINKKFHSLSKLNPWMKKIIIILAFILIYIAIKEVAFTIMKYFGVDVGKIMLRGINNTVGNN